MGGAVEAEDDALVVHLGGDADRAAPELVDVLERVARPILLEVDAVVRVAHQQLAAVLPVAVDDVDDRLSEVGERGEELRLDLAELARLDLPVTGVLVEAVGEQALLAREVFGEELVDEGDVVVELA